ncbi:hypothetical protein OH76DRAFT_1553931 [Lentinus brumalis]|uniref:HNH nuclease domain-containing protein n=1 Tax=Lentinus brumalis TaxID=2498619 RepID=A0A371DJJ3_9APHY|nr:hypothetical protein OH76DRAFT_1553931 [Polyporus brumalis]
MARYGHDREAEAGIDDTANIISLRCDVRDCLVRHGFVLHPHPHPKPAKNGSRISAISRRYVSYVVEWGETEYADLFHGRAATMPEHVHVAEQFLYARFAHTVIQLLRRHELYWEWDPAATVPVQTDITRTQEARRSRMRAEQEWRRKWKETKRALAERYRDRGSRSGSDEDEDEAYAKPVFHPDIAAQDKEWETTWHKIFPRFREEVEHPPDGDLYGVWTHPETPRMDRLRDEYIQNNPQVWQTTTTAPGSVRPKTDYEALFYVMPCEKDSRFFFDSYNDRGH